MRKKPSTQIGHNSGKRRSREAIANEIHGLQRRNVFEIGALLAEAREGLEHGEWQTWFDKQQFDFGYTTALNYLKAHDLKLKCPTVVHLRVPPTIIYELAYGEGYGEDDDLQAVVKELETASKTKPLTVDEANDIIWLVRARRKWGDLPKATLNAIEDAEFKPWSAAAIEELKQARPETDEAADAIVMKHSVDPTREGSAEKEESSGNGSAVLASIEQKTTIPPTVHAFIEPKTPGADDDKATLQAEKARIIRAWADASAGAKAEFVRERWDEIFIVRKQLDAAAQDEDRWLEGDDAR